MVNSSQAPTRFRTYGEEKQRNVSNRLEIVALQEKGRSCEVVAEQWREHVRAAFYDEACDIIETGGLHGRQTADSSRDILNSYFGGLYFII